MILVPPFAGPPMRCPDEVWAMLVLAVDIVGDADPDRAGEVALFAGSWVPEQPTADLYDGDLVLRLACPEHGPTYEWHVAHADIEMLLADHGRWQRVGRWCGVDGRWPRMVAPTAAAVMGLHGDLAQAAISYHAATAGARPRLKWARGGVAELIEAGLVHPGDELVWDRRNLGERHTAQVRGDGCILLPDGSFYANPSGALAAVGGIHMSGWKNLEARLGRAHPGRPASRTASATRAMKRRGPSEVSLVRQCLSTVDNLVLVGPLAAIGPGPTLEAVAVRLAQDIAELRDDGGIPLQVRTEITVLPCQRVLEIRVRGLSIEADPDRTTIREVMITLFERASFHNVVALDGNQPSLFTQRILLLDTDGRPFAALIGAAVGDVEALAEPRDLSPWARAGRS